MFKKEIIAKMLVFVGYALSAGLLGTIVFYCLWLALALGSFLQGHEMFGVQYMPIPWPWDATVSSNIVTILAGAVAMWTVVVCLRAIKLLAHMSHTIRTW
jgi:hypothetical protein